MIEEKIIELRVLASAAGANGKNVELTPAAARRLSDVMEHLHNDLRFNRRLAFALFCTTALLFAWVLLR